MPGVVFPAGEAWNVCEVGVVGDLVPGAIEDDVLPARLIRVGFEEAFDPRIIVDQNLSADERFVMRGDHPSIRGKSVEEADDPLRLFGGAMMCFVDR